MKFGESPYALMGNNPISRTEPDGDSDGDDEDKSLVKTHKFSDVPTLSDQKNNGRQPVKLNRLRILF